MAKRIYTIEVDANVTGFQAKMKAAGSSAKNAFSESGKEVKKNSALVDDMSMRVGKFGLAATAAVGFAVKKFADFDSAMSGVQAATMESTANMAKLRQAAIDAGADTQYSATESAAAITELGKAGLSTTDILSGGLSGALDLAASDQIEVAKAAEISSAALVQFGLSGEDAAHVADLLAAGAGKALGGVEDLGAALNNVGTTAKDAGFSIEETTGFLSAMASYGLTGAEAGTQLKSMLQSLQGPSGTAAKAMQELGLSLYDNAGNTKTLTQFVAEYTTTMQGRTDAERAAYNTTIFGSYGIKAANVAYREGADGIQKWVDAVDDSGYASRQAAIRTDNLAGDIERLGGAVDTALIQTGSGANGALRNLTQGLTAVVDVVGQIPTPILTIGTVLTGVVGVTALATAGFGKMATSIVASRAAMKTMRTESPRLATALTRTGKIAAKAGAGIGIYLAAAAASPHEGLDGANEMTAALEKVAASGGDVSSMFEKISGGNWFTGTFDSADDFKAAVKEIADPSMFEKGDVAVRNFVNGVGGIFGQDWRGNWDKGIDQIKAYGAQLGSMSETDLPTAQAAFKSMWLAAGGDAEAADRLLEAMPEYRDQLVGLANDAGMAVHPAKLQAIATGEVTEEMLKGKSATEDAVAADRARAASMGYVGEMSEAAADALKEWRDAGAEAYAAFIDPMDAYGTALTALEDKERERAEAAAEASGDAKASWEDFYDEVSVSAKDYIEQLRDQAKAQENWRDNLLNVSQRLRDALPSDMQQTVNEMIDYYRNLGPEGAEQVALLESMSDKQLAKVANTFKRRGGEATDNFNNELDRIRNVTADVDADTSPALAEINRFIRDQQGRIIRIKVKGGDSEIRTGAGNQVAKASGGAISGPGTATSDSIPAWLSNGEHVLTASDVDKLGGQGAVYRMRGLAQSGMLKFATGGAVSTAKANRDSAKAEVKAAERTQKRAQERYSDIGSGKDDRAAKSAAKKALDAAKDAKKKADKALKRAESALEDARQRAEYRAEYARNNLRGDTVLSAVQSGNGLSAVDDMLSWANSGAFNDSTSKALRRLAEQSEKRLVKLNAALEDATTAFDQLSALYDDVRGGLKSGFSFDSLLGQTNAFGFASGGSGNDLAAGAQAYAGKITTLGTKITQLRAAGASPALIEQIATMPLDTALQVADAFLADPGSASMASKALSAIDTEANKVGFNVAQGAAGAAAAGLYMERGGDLGSAAVDALQADMSNLGNQMADAFMQAIASSNFYTGPSGGTIGGTGKKSAKKKAKKRALGGPVSAGEPYLVGEGGMELFVPGVSGAIIPSRLTIPAVQASSSVTNTAVPIDYDRLAQAVVVASESRPMVIKLEAGREFQSKATQGGLTELKRSGSPVLREVF